MGDSDFWFGLANHYTQDENCDLIEVWGDDVTHVNVGKLAPIHSFDNGYDFENWATEQLTQQQTRYVDAATHKEWTENPDADFAYGVILPEDRLIKLFQDKDAVRLFLMGRF